MKKIVISLLCMLTLLPINNQNDEKIFFDEEIKTSNSSAIRIENNPCLKMFATLPKTYIDNYSEIGFIYMPLLKIKDIADFNLNNEYIKKYIVAKDEYIIEDDNINIKGIMNIDNDDFTSDFAFRAYALKDNTICYSKNISVLNYYRICEKIENLNDDKESIIKFAKSYKELNDNGFTFEYNQQSASYKITAYNSNVLENAVIPTYYKGFAVTEIGESAFINSSIKTLIIPESIKTIGKNAFKDCSFLSLYVDVDNYIDTWNIDCNPSHCPIYYNIKNKLHHKEYLDDNTKHLTETYIYQLINAGSEAYNQENYPISKFHYSDAVMMSGLLDLYDVAKEPFYLNSTLKIMNNFINLNKCSFKYTPSSGQLDSIPGGDVLLRLYNITKNENYKTLSKRMQEILFSSKRINCEGNNFYHKDNYPNQIWLDGLYMAMPYYCRYETMSNNNKNYKDIYTQYKYVYDNMRDNSTGLYYHGYDFSGQQDWSKHNKNNPNCSQSFWGRGMGWLLASLVNVIDIMTPLNENEEMYKNFLIQMVKDGIESVYNYVDEKTGMFYQVLDKQDENGNYLETSGSSLICFATLKANRLGILNESYYQKGLNTFKGILNTKLEYSNQLNRYTLKDINKVAGLSDNRNGTFEYYISESIVNDNAKGSGPLLMAYAELLR